MEGGGGEAERGWGETEDWKRAAVRGTEMDEMQGQIDAWTERNSRPSDSCKPLPSAELQHRSKVKAMPRTAATLP